MRNSEGKSARRTLLKAMTGASLAPAMAPARKTTRAKIGYGIRLDTIHRGWAKDFTEVNQQGYHKNCWVHARVGAIPGDSPEIVVVTQKLLMSGSDVFFAFNDMRTKDMGKTWSPLVEHESLGRRKEAGGLESVITAIVPSWHTKTRKLLATGSVIRYRGDVYAGTSAPRETGYSVYNPAERSWTPWQTLEMPGGDRFFNCGADFASR